MRGEPHGGVPGIECLPDITEGEAGAPGASGFWVPGDSLATPLHHAVRQESRRFAEDFVGPRVETFDRTGRIDYVLPRMIARYGWFGSIIPKQYGGKGDGHLAAAVRFEESARGDGRGAGYAGAAHQASSLPIIGIINYGTDAQKRHWLPRLAQGDSITTIETTEWRSGGTIGSIATSAEPIRRNGSLEWVIRGRKTMIGNGAAIGKTGVRMVIARTGDNLTAFLVENDRKGVGVGTEGDQDGLKGFSFPEVRYHEVVVPDDNRLGEVGQGHDVAKSSSIMAGRNCLGAVALGVHQAVAETSLLYARERRARSACHYDNPVIKDMLGRMIIELEASRMAVYGAAHALDRGTCQDTMLMAAKHTAVVNALRAVSLSREIFGSHGIQNYYPIARAGRDAPCINPPAAMTAIQRRGAVVGAAMPYGQDYSSGEFRKQAMQAVDTAIARL